MLSYLLQNRHLALQLAKREIMSKYKASFLGFFWSFANPIFLLMIYTFVFSFIMKVRLPTGGDTIDFALFQFTGMILWMSFAESVGSSASLIIDNRNFVKKVRFPLETLVVAKVLSSFFHALIALVILFVSLAIFRPNFHWEMVLFPLPFIPLFLLSVGLGWLVAALGVFIRDIKEAVIIILTSWMFLTPIFYPMSLVPQPVLPYMKLNPMAIIIDTLRRLVLHGQFPEWPQYAIVTIMGLAFFLGGFYFFHRAKPAFSDVL